VAHKVPTWRRPARATPSTSSQGKEGQGGEGARLHPHLLHVAHGLALCLGNHDQAGTPGRRDGVFPLYEVENASTGSRWRSRRSFVPSGIIEAQGVPPFKAFGHRNDPGAVNREWEILMNKSSACSPGEVPRHGTKQKTEDRVTGMSAVSSAAGMERSSTTGPVRRRRPPTQASRRCWATSPSRPFSAGTAWSSRMPLRTSRRWPRIPEGGEEAVLRRVLRLQHRHRPVDRTPRGLIAARARSRTSPRSSGSAKGVMELSKCNFGRASAVTPCSTPSDTTRKNSWP